MNAEKTTDELKKDISHNEGYAELGAWIVVIGLLVEIASAIWLDAETKSEKYSLIFANSLIAIGVYCEIHFGRKSRTAGDVLQHKSEERIAATNERAAILEKEAAEARQRTAEIERLTAWRRISREQTQQIIEAIREIASSINVLIEYEQSDPEAYRYALDFIGIFSAIRTNEVRHVQNSFPLTTSFGVYMANTPELDALPILNAFVKAKIPFDLISFDNTSFGARRSPTNLYIFVAPKPPPEYVRESNI
jgi:hypothetical protein